MPKLLITGEGEIYDNSTTMTVEPYNYRDGSVMVSIERENGTEVSIYLTLDQAKMLKKHLKTLTKMLKETSRQY